MSSFVNLQSSSYNALLPIAAANRALTALGEEEIVGRILSVIQRSGLQDMLGVRLLHKHNDIAENEIMYETVSIDSEGLALTTRAIDSNQADVRVPNSWQLIGEHFVPVEFSDPLLLNGRSFDLEANAEVFAEIADILRESGTEQLLGPCLHYGEFVKDQDPYLSSAFLEKTDFEDRANVVRFVELNDPSFTNSAKTKWRAVQVIDASGNMVWTTACNCFCSVFPRGGHQGTKTHRYNPSN